MKNLKYKLIIFALSFLPFFSCNKDGTLNLLSCELEPDSGPCEAAMVKYYFDKYEKKCKEFLYGGCEGTVPFDSMEECLECECL
jgi:hypothetical protein